MKIYLAGGSTEAELVQGYGARLVERGFVITQDWTKEVLKGQGDANLTQPEAMSAAMADLAGVVRAEIIWVLLPVKPSFGAGVELGFALGRGGRLVIVSGAHKASIFSTLAHFRFDTHEDALAFLGRRINEETDTLTGVDPFPTSATVEEREPR